MQASCRTRALPIPPGRRRLSCRARSEPRSPTCCRPSTFSPPRAPSASTPSRSEEHTSELQSRENLVCRLLLEKKKQHKCLISFMKKKKNHKKNINNLIII